MRAEADLRQRRRDLIRYGLMWGSGDLVPEHCAGLCLARQFCDHRGRGTLRSTSDEPLDLVGSVCGHHARIVRWRRRSGVEASSVIASAAKQSILRLG
jgi:acetylglutamate kinase